MATEDKVMEKAPAAEAPSLHRLMRPGSIAIIGASDKPGSLGASVLANLDRAGYAGEIYPVNPKRESLGGRRCYASVEALPEGVDVAILAIPQAGVVDAVRALAARRTGSAIIFAAGFAEGGAEGLRQQQEIARIAAESGMIVEGPNCLGLVNFADNIPLTFIELPEARAGGDRRVGIVSQSGAIAAVLATTMISRDVPLSCYVSTGNEAASGVDDYVLHLVGDPETQVIAMVVEHFRNPGRFLQAARAASDAGKTIVLLHPGRSEARRESAATHTGAMAGDYQVMRALCERAGVILVDGLEELGDVSELMLRCRIAPGRDPAVVAESGALKALILDQAEALGMRLPRLGDADSPELRAALPPFVPVSNPLDITAQGLVDPGLYGRTIGALLADARVGTILVPIIQTDISTSSIKLRAISEALEGRTLPKPVIVAGVDEGGGVSATDIARLRGMGIAYFPTPERAMRAIACLGRHGRRPTGRSDASPIGLSPLPPLSMVPEYQAKALLSPHGIAFSPARMATTVAEARAAAAELGYPVVLKAQASDLGHKSDAGGVILNLGDADAVSAGWERLHANVAAARPGLVLDGVLVEAMAPRGIELIVGARVDPQWGPVILVGFGGVTAELLHDAVLLPHDLDRQSIVDSILGLRMAPLLTGFRGAPPADVEAVADIVMALGRVLAGTPEISEIDLNPVVVYPKGEGALALDALISL